MMLSDCSRLGEGYYRAPLLGQNMVTYVVQSWKYLPNYRLRNFIHILSLEKYIFVSTPGKIGCGFDPYGTLCNTIFP
jgi:hypothetical protein